MRILNFESFWEFNAFVTFVMLGMAIMMVISAVTAIPNYISKYYEYATGIPDVECENPTFWNNANTFFNLGTYVTQLVFETMTLLPSVRRIPLRYRMMTGLFIPLAEMLVLIIVPVIKVPTQSGAIAVIMTISCVAGFANALLDSSTNALVGPFPTQFFNGEQWGTTIAAVIMCLISVVLQASMGTDFDDISLQSRIYFGIAIGFQVFMIIQFVLLISNPFAQQYVAEFRLLKQGEREDVSSVGPLNTDNDVDPEAIDVPNSDGIEKHPVEGMDEGDSDSNYEKVNAAVLRAKGDADGMVDRDQNGTMTSSDQMVQANLCTVLRKVYPMLMSTVVVFMVTLTMWPGLFFSTYSGDKEWFATIIVLLFNCGDFISRMILMVRAFRPSPLVCVIGSASRVLFIPLIALCVHGTIDNEVLPYILVTLFGLTNGYFGTMSMIYCPRTPTLSTAGERSIAGIMAGLGLQGGLAIGANLAAVINVFIPG